MKIEVCANSYESAVAAQNAGADRIELCIQLSVGGLTPSYGLIQKVIDDLTIPVHVLIRPRAGGFCYIKEELDIMIRDIQFCKKTGCAGVVSGVLTSDSELDISATKKLIEAAEEMEFTFHRAFDVVSNPLETLKQLQTLGIARVLSSGQQPKAINGIELLKRMKANASQIQVMPGSGINPSNAIAFKEAGFEMIHFSASKKITIPEATTAVSFQEGMEATADGAIIKQIIKLVKNDDLII